MDDQKALKTLNSKSAILPILLSIAILGFMFWRDDQLNQESLSAITAISLGSLVIAIITLFTKDGLNMLRFRVMSEGELSLRSAFYIVMLWEFTVAVAPPLVGATTVLIFVINREGVPLGKALAYALLAASLDNLFFITATPLAIWWSGGAVIPDVALFPDQPDTKIYYLFWLSYLMILGFTMFMLSAIVLMPKFINQMTMKLLKFSWLKRFEPMAIEQSHHLFEASKQLKGKSGWFWLKLIGITYLIWLFKYAVLSIVGSGFVAMSLSEHLLAIGKHLIFWVALLVSPSPGNAGTAEFVFPVFYGEELGSYTFASSLVWRFITYYPYLILGALLLPRWLTRKNA